MNKKFLLVAALCAAMNLSSFAEEIKNLALNKNVTVSSGANSGNVVDGNLNTRWEVATGDEKQNGGIVEEGSYWFYIDLEKPETFNTLRIRWEGGYAKKFKVLVADELDEATGKPKWKDEAVLTKEEALSDFNKYYAYFLDNDVTARYVKVQAEELGLAPYFSVWEMGIYELTAEQKTPSITTIGASKNTVAPGEEFTVTVEDQFGNAMTDVTYTCTNAEDLGNGRFKAENNGEITITAKDKNDKEMTVKLTAYVPAMATVNVSPAFVITGQETPLTFTVLDQEGKVITDYTTSLTDNKITATEDGVQTITVTAGGVEKQVQVYAVSSAPATPTLGVTDMPIFVDDATGLETYNSGWEGGYNTQNIMDLGDKKVAAVTQVATYGWQKTSIEDTDYSTLEFDIFPTKDLDDVYVRYQDANIDDQHFSAKAGEWKHVSLDITGGARYNSYIKFKLAAENSEKASRPDVLLANVYLKKAAADQGVVIGTKADANGFVSVKGEITTDDLAKLAETDGTAFDLTKATLGEGVTAVQFKNPNAIIQVAGTLVDNKGVPAADWGETKNVVVKDREWYFPAKQLEITDKYAVYRKFYISGNAGYKYTRSLAAKTYSTVYLNHAAAVPAGCKVYEFVADETAANKVILKETAAINALTPYIVYNGNEEDAELVSEFTGNDVNFMAADNAKAVGNLNAIGTFDYFTGNDKDVTVYGIQKENGADGKLTLKKVTTAAVCPFRVYFTVAGNDEAAAKAITFDIEGTATGIKDIHAVDAAKAGNVYSIDGKLVKANAATTEGLSKGVYVINGKKYVVK